MDIKNMPMDIGDAVLQEGSNTYFEAGIAWSGKMSLVDELMICRNEGGKLKPILGGVKAHAQVFRLKDIPSDLFSVHIFRMDNDTNVEGFLEEKHRRVINPNEMVTVVTLNLSAKQVELTLQK